MRGIFPIVAVIDRAGGYREISEDDLTAVVTSLIDERGDRARGHVSNIG